MPKAARRSLSRAGRLLADRAVLVALLVMALLAVLTAVGSRLVLRDGEDSSIGRTDVTAELAAAYVDAQLSGLADLVATWTERPLMLSTLATARDGRLPPESAADAFRLVESLRLAKVEAQYAFMTDAAGVSLANSPQNDAALGMSFADRDWFRGAVATGRTYVSEVYRARVTTGQPWVVAVAAPVYGPRSGGDERGPLLGVVAATYSVSDLQAFVDRTAREDEVLELVDHHGLVVARTGDPGAVGTLGGGDPLAASALGGDLGADRRSVDGQDLVAAWRPLLTGDWGLTVRQPASTALADARRSATALGTLAAVLLAGVAVGTALYRAGRDRRRIALAQAEAVRRASEERFGALYAASPVGIIEGSPEGIVYSVNRAMAEMLGYAPDEMVGSDARAYAHPDSAPEIGTSMRELMEGRLNAYTVERLYRHCDGHAVPVLVSLSAVRRVDGSVERLVAAVTDITALRESEHALRSSEERFRTAFQASLLGMVLLDEDGRVLQVNPAAEEFFCRPQSDLVGVDLCRLAGEADRDALQEAVRDALGGERPRLELAFPVPSGPRRWGLLGIVATPGAEGALLVQVEDVTERRAAEQLLSTQALHDPLTHLPNRRLLLDRLEHSLQGAARTEGLRPALLFIDLDGFKSVNDRFGHEAGDALLCEAADRLRAQVRPTDTVARLGGDEFVVLDEAVADIADVRVLAHRLLAALAAPWPPGQQLTASIGVAIAQPGQSAEGLLRDADHAMYRAKQLGKNRYEAYDEQLRASAERRMRVEDELRTAMADDAFVLVFQPVVDLAEMRVTGVEALLRMRRPGGGLVEAIHFMEVAEDSGLVVPLGRWVLDEACRRAAVHHRVRGTWLPVAVNVSARQAARPDLEEIVLGRLAEHGVPGHVLSLEITESVLLSAANSTLAQLDRLRSHGVQIGLDDFGTGFSSLSYLAELPLDFLKVDRSFVMGLPDDRTACAIVESTVGLALRLGLRCVAEGIETQAQLEMIRAMGPVEGQGYLLARPLDAHRLSHELAGVPRPRQGEEPALVW